MRYLVHDQRIILYLFFSIKLKQGKNAHKTALSFILLKKEMTQQEQQQSTKYSWGTNRQSDEQTDRQRGS